MKHSRRRNSKALRVDQVEIHFTRLRQDAPCGSMGSFTNKAISACGGLATTVAKLLDALEFRS